MKTSIFGTLFRSKKSSNVRLDRLVRGPFGNKLTAYFLRSKYVKMMSEGDYIYRIRILARSFYILPFFVFFFALYLYYRVTWQNISGDEIDQKKIINIVLLVVGYHLVLITTVIIFMMHQSMNPYVIIFKMLYNTLYIVEIMLMFSICFLARWTGVLYKGITLTQLLADVREYWIYIISYILIAFTLKPLTGIFNDINEWYLEWERISRYQDSKDKENAFIFKKWITPEERKARNILRNLSFLNFVLANIVVVADAFLKMNFYDMSLILLSSSYFMYLGSYVFPFNAYSIIYYGLIFLVTTAQMFYCFYLIQNKAYLSGNTYLYAYFYSVIPWVASLRSLIIYIWIIKDKPEIKAIVINQFEKAEDFDEFVKTMSTDKLLQSESVDENKIDYSTDTI